MNDMMTLSQRADALEEKMAGSSTTSSSSRGSTAWPKAT